MSSEQNPGQAPARRRMAGYTPPAAQPASQATEHEAPAVSEPETPAHEAQVPEQSEPTPAAQTSVEPAEPASAGPVDQQEQTPAPAATDAPARKRRMGSAPAPAAAAKPAAPIDQDASPPGPETPAAEPAAGESAASPASPAAANAPAAPTAGAPKRRMGSAPAAPATTPAAPAPEAPATGTDEATAAPKKRMGGAPAPAKTRMGGAPAAGTAASTAAATSSAVPASTGSATPTTASSSAAPSNAPTSGTAATTTSANRPSSGRMGSAGAAGTPGPAGTATPKKPERPWVKPALIIGGLVVVAVAVVLGARWLRTLEGVQEFIATYDGHSTQLEAAPEGMPWWMGWQHFFNMFLIVLIIRTGLQVRTERKPPGYWTAKKGSFFSPKGNTPKKVSLSQWLHQVLDVLWVLNGLIFVVLLIVTGHWMRIVPTDWDVFPNMLSGAIQYASLDWPTENGWVHYNALQTVAYGFTVFIAAPLAILSGIRFSTWWPQNAEKLNKIYPVEWARATHFPVMLYFVGFTIVHVFLVFFTGALANLNHMYTSRDVVDWWGLVIFLVSLVVIAAAWFLTKPLFTTPIAARMGKVSK
ncbi:cytochrome b/b6 domain-containing protein [Citricoccus zhacaiensis]|uniref:cytochrome b/b6 domain-containing protein n=1 Tax=Citricoccus zhacaiensis TaxID=489142 RepID=UPI001E29AF8B|nr:cytochrome b/b6 domain-containing protein [Citricoccus zhacaiensis]